MRVVECRGSGAHRERHPSFGRGTLELGLYVAEDLRNDGMGTDGRCPKSLARTKLVRITADTQAPAESGTACL